MDEKLIIISREGLQPPFPTFLDPSVYIVLNPCFAKLH